MASLSTYKKGGSVTTAASLYTMPIKHEQNIATLVAAGLATTQYSVISTIPANTYVKVLCLQNISALSLGAGPAISLGDSSSATRFVNASSVVTALTNHTLASTEFYYNAADELRLTITGGTLASGTIRAVWLFWDCTRNAPMTT